MAPRGFHKEEMEKIREKLIEVARRKFGAFGLKKTSIKDLTDECGIAQGSFYKFFDSKEHLYFAILELDEIEIKAELMKEFNGISKMNAAQFAKIIIHAFQLVEKYPVIQRMYFLDEYEALVRKLPAELIENHITSDASVFAPLFQQWREEKVIDSTLSPGVITAALRMLFILTAHKREIGENIFDESLQLLIESLASRMFKEG
ncbi:DNA-binding transcriptional regulator, AcrR family [Evansella caseinilytica]|uniref:DNA-binding transcriptional regulator, AcrR family n=1 Tax=Evansella caseinilytica TaxID=1503961 RepID=A0A1H3QT77_9BACI|nr:TetR/AcrR family transcriptional regulator [Evansella caseinilytica]SDZ16540.1 DNA-binding transcriptional regulator, AcrR family [Evansella caseinilytica]